jgi:Type II secretion system (T2SS), protein M subtype b
MTALGTRDRRALTMGVATVLIALVASRGAPAWYAALERAREESASAARSSRDARSLLSSLPAMRDSLIARRATLLGALPLVTSAPDANAAASSLSGAVSRAAADAGLATIAVSLRPDTIVVRGLSRSRVSLEARGDVSGLMQFLLLLEAGPPMMRVVEMTVTQPDPIGEARAEELRIMLVAEGVARYVGSDPKVSR